MSMRSATMRRPAARMAPLMLALALLLPTPAVTGGDSLDTRVSRQGEVEVAVTPRSLAPDAEVWVFEVGFNTHTVALDGDPDDNSVLIDADGNEHAALEWDGAPPGGHHRSGELHFAALPEAQGPIELRVGGVGGIEPRTFRWER